MKRKIVAVIATLFLIILFNANDIEAAANGWHYNGNNWYYYQSGKPYKGWLYDTDKKWYYLKHDGTMATGWLNDRGTWYYLNPSGAMVTGWLNDHGTWYYLNPSGAMVTGWLNDRGTWYYLNPSGAMVTGWLKYGGVWYYFNSSGAMVTGWFNDGTNWYYLDSSGAMKTGWINVDNTWYYLDSSGRMLTGWITDGGIKYFLNSSGAMQTGWLEQDGKKYYFKPNGSMATGFVDVDGNRLYFDENGVYQFSLVKSGDDWNYILPDGSKATGWMQFGSHKVYFDENGILQTGLVEIDGTKYYFNNNGIMQTKWVLIDKVWYYFDPSSGAMHTGWLLDENGAWYYLDPSSGAMQTKWVYVDGDWYYLNSSTGKMHTNWLYLEPHWYYFDRTGRMVTGWLQLGQNWFYFKDNGMMATGWAHDGHAWYFFDSNGYWDGNTGISSVVTNYDIDFNKLVDIQVAAIPKADGAGNFIASREAVAYYLNPNNFPKDSQEYYQFLLLSIPTNMDPNEINEKILKDKGILDGQGQAFVDAAKTHNINEAYLISHALHETGHGTSPLSQGIPVDSNGNVIRDSEGNLDFDAPGARLVYNMFGYGARDSDPLNGGAKYAFDRGWFTPYDAIVGGAAEISVNYIQAGQDTLYKMKWNPENPGTHQYATHVQWAVLQTKNIANIYSQLDTYVLTFDEPKFLNQPGPTKKPEGDELYAVFPVNESSATVNGSVILRRFPGYGSALLTVQSGTNVTVLGTNNGWYKISLTHNSKEYTGWVPGQNLTF